MPVHAATHVIPLRPSWSSGDYHLSLHRLQGDERFHLALNEAGKVMDVCRTGQRASA